MVSCYWSYITRHKWLKLLLACNKNTNVVVKVHQYVKTQAIIIYIYIYIYSLCRAKRHSVYCTVTACAFLWSWSRWKRENSESIQHATSVTNNSSLLAHVTHFALDEAVPKQGRLLPQLLVDL